MSQCFQKRNTSKQHSHFKQNKRLKSLEPIFVRFPFGTGNSLGKLQNHPCCFQGFRPEFCGNTHIRWYSFRISQHWSCYSFTYTRDLKNNPLQKWTMFPWKETIFSKDIFIFQPFIFTEHLSFQGRNCHFHGGFLSYEKKQPINFGCLFWSLGASVPVANDASTW